MITSDKSDIVLVLPVEYVDILLEAFSIGLQRVVVEPKTRKEILAWWDVEKDFIEKDFFGDMYKHKL